jgi:hypothetical protein
VASPEADLALPLPQAVVPMASPTAVTHRRGAAVRWLHRWPHEQVLGSSERVPDLVSECPIWLLGAMMAHRSSELGQRHVDRLDGPVDGLVDGYFFFFVFSD